MTLPQPRKLSRKKVTLTTTQNSSASQISFHHEQERTDYDTTCDAIACRIIVHEVTRLHSNISIPATTTIQLFTGFAENTNTINHKLWSCPPLDAGRETALHNLNPSPQSLEAWLFPPKRHTTYPNGGNGFQ